MRPPPTQIKVHHNTYDGLWYVLKIYHSIHLSLFIHQITLLPLSLNNFLPPEPSPPCETAAGAPYLKAGVRDTANTSCHTSLMPSYSSSH